ncbi:MAG TPA: metallophosphoesterase [Candidatus Limnocylindria bacterium]|nr:metallophosphoesterase [Candidatus Limnocylindria bacterium]
MKVHVVSDVHARLDALVRSLDEADVLVCLGDLVLFLDYEDPAQGIFGELFGAENARTFVDLRTSGRLDEARVFSAGLWEARGGDRATTTLEAVRGQYARTFAAIPEPTYLTYGNVDLPDLWPEFARPGHRVLDGDVVEIGGRTVGFVGGGLRTAYRTPYEISDEEYAAKVAAVEGADILCTHIPPAIPELTYDVVARRFERGSVALLAAIRRSRPLFSLFGHVHQPLVARTRVDRTECVNVGHFRGQGSGLVLDL